jgi:hypothetical protein
VVYLYRMRHFRVFLPGLLLALSCPGFLPGQSLRAPVRHNLVLTGSFGDLRPDHFHAGIDLRSSAGVAGDPILAAAAGYVSRVIIHHEGYGQALHVRHTDGRTTVYAHLHRFAPAIQAWVDTIRYALQREEVDLVLESTRFPVRQGQVIGTMGTTGRSTGVHLHFELRDRDGYQALDPLAYGLTVGDKTPPDITGLKIYALDEKLLPLFEEAVPLRKRGQEYRVRGDTLLVGAWRVGLGIAASDDVEDTRFRIGIRSIEIHVDGEQVYGYRMDKLDLRLNRYINAHLDYGEWARSGARLHRCYPLPGNRLPLYPVLRKAGLITLSRYETRAVRVVVGDKSGRTRELRFWIRRDESMPEPPPRQYQFRIPFGEAFAREDVDIRWQIPSGALYETTYFEYARLEKTDGSVQYQLHQPTTPLHRFMDLALALPEEGSGEWSRYVAVYREKDQLYTCGGEEREGWLHLQTRRFGTYQLYKDTLAPEILPRHLPEVWKKGEILRVGVRDDLQGSAELRNLFWEIRVNGQWIPASWIYKDQELLIDPSRHMVRGENRILIRVWDERGNRRELEQALAW